jgi:hypothetical protein
LETVSSNASPLQYNIQVFFQENKIFKDKRPMVAAVLILLIFQVKGLLLLELLMIMAMDGQFPRLLLQLVLKSLLVHGCRYVDRTLAIHLFGRFCLLVIS